MNIIEADPRDAGITTLDATFRVELWRQVGAWPDGGEPGLEWQARAVTITDADVVEVLGWASEEAGAEQVMTVYVQAGDDLVRIFGIDPTDEPDAA